MSAPATLAEPTPNPDPHQDQAAADMPPGIAHLLTLLRCLIACGKNLAASVQRHTAVASFRAFNTFGTNDMALIFARITRGLMRAAALRDMLLRRAATGRDVAPPPLRTASPRTATRVRPAARARVVRVDDPGSVFLPTPEELAAEVRRRPIGAVLADIFTDLGITPADLDPGRGDELFAAIISYGGDYVRFVVELMKRCVLCVPLEEPPDLPPPALLPPLSLPAPCTRPP